MVGGYQQNQGYQCLDDSWYSDQLLELLQNSRHI